MNSTLLACLFQLEQPSLQPDLVVNIGTCTVKFALGDFQPLPGALKLAQQARLRVASQGLLVLTKRLLQLSCRIYAVRMCPLSKQTASSSLQPCRSLLKPSRVDA